MKFQKTKYYAVDIDGKTIIDLPMEKEHDAFLVCRGTNFTTIKGKRLNEHKCYAEFIIIPLREPEQ